MVEEIRDRFGTPPQEVQNLLDLMSIRILLKNIGINRLDVGRSSITLTFAKDRTVDTEKLVQLVNSEPQRHKFLSQHKLKVNMSLISGSVDLHEIEKTIESFNLH